MRQTTLLRSTIALRTCALALFALLSLSVGCSSTETRTQLTFSISASSGLQSRIQTLHVSIRSNSREDQSSDFAASELHWPVEIVVIPRAGNQSTDDVTLTATAIGASATVLAMQSASGKFVPDELRIIAVPLDRDSMGSGVSDGGVHQAGSRDAAQVRDTGVPDQTEPDARGHGDASGSEPSTSTSADAGTTGQPRDASRPAPDASTTTDADAGMTGQPRDASRPAPDASTTTDTAQADAALADAALADAAVR